MAKGIIQSYQEKLMKAGSKEITELLAQMKPWIQEHCADLTKFSLVEQFKMQGLVLTFSTLYRNLGLPEDPSLNDLQKSYSEEIMQKLAQHLLNEFAWVHKNPVPLHALFERTAAKKAALKIYSLAEDLINSPEDKEKIQALYTALQRHRVILKDKYLFSISHSSPRTVINDALDAIDSLNNAPSCDLDFRQKCHDKVVSEHQLTAFRRVLTNASPYFFNTYDPIWEHMKKTLLEISRQSKNNPSHIVQELYEATVRFSSYKAYHPYLSQLNALKKHLLRSIEELDKPDGLNQDVQESLFAQKQNQFATLLKVNPKQVRIQSGSDGMQSYIELQVEDAPLQEGFTGYQSSFLTRVEAERSELRKLRATLEENKEALLKLANVQVIEILPVRKRPAFEKLFRLKGLLTLDWNLDIDRSELPDLIRQKLEHVDELKHWNWKLNPVDQSRLNTILGKDPDLSITASINEQSSIQSDLDKIKVRIQDANERIRLKQKEISDTEEIITAAEKRMKEKDCNYVEGLKLRGTIFLRQRDVLSFHSQLEELRETLSSIREEETERMDALSDHNVGLDGKRTELIQELLIQIKQDLASYLDEASEQYVAGIEKELLETDPVIEKIEKEEVQKTRYQTRRFFKTSELLHYEASLVSEEAGFQQKEMWLLPQPYMMNMKFKIQEF